MVNTYRKGLYVENKVKKLMEQSGWIVHRAKISRFQSNDFFSCWDIICIKKGDPNKWIQVKSGRIEKKELQRLKDFCDKNFDDSAKINRGYVYVYRKRMFDIFAL